MRTGSTLKMWRLGLMLALFCSMNLPQLAGAARAIPTGPHDAYQGIPDYYTTANWTNSPPLAKFVDTLPGLTIANKNNLEQYLPVAVPDKTTFPGSDYYIIELREYWEKMHSDLNPTRLRGYVQVNADGTDQAPPHYLGPIIVAQRDVPIRIKFTNKLNPGTGGDLFIPVDTSVMGAGEGPLGPSAGNYTQNRAAIHLHGGRTPWISDGTPHQWITPADETSPYKTGVSLQNVPDMCFDSAGNAIPRAVDPNCTTGSSNPGPGSTTYYFTNQQSARLMFYHDHAFGITRLNVYAGEAAGYLITDKFEKDLIDNSIIPAEQIPLIIQDKTFVNADVTIHPSTDPVFGGGKVMTVRETDPLWNWGSLPPVDGVVPPVTGDLWMPHVYMPAQLPTESGTGGVNPFGRWMYGPWFYPATAVTHGPVANPYYDPHCSSSDPFELAECATPGQPPLIPGTPNVSMGMEAFQDSVVVNGTAFPALTVDPKAYRFRILNAAGDRFQNLSFYVADDALDNVSTDPRLPVVTDFVAGRSNKTEVKMAAASPENAAAGNWPPSWPVDGREERVPDPGTCTNSGTATDPVWNCTNWGPKFLQIGTEGGFLPQPVTIAPQPITYNTDPTAFWVGNVDKMALALGPAERADVIVDFSAYAGKTLILYNDAPAAWPARVAGYDYYTGAPDMRDSGGYGTGGTLNPATGAWEGGSGPLPGYAPNTRTVMQVIVRDIAPVTFNKGPLENEFTSTANPSGKTLFERSQEPIIVGQPAYSSTYPNSYFPTNFPWEGVNQMNDQFLQFVTLAGEKVKVTTEPKGIHDEMGASFDPEYGRMSGNLAMQLPNPTTLNANLILYGYQDIPTETVKNSIGVNVTVMPDPADPNKPGTLADGTQIWKISHNGVDTHPIHFHIFDVQLVNRVGWDGQILMPEPNELGWKDTVKISPLEDTIVAVRPRAPALPFGIPNSLRPLNPAIPIDSAMNFTTPTPGSDWPFFRSIDWTTGAAYVYTPAVPPLPAEPVIPAYPYEYYKGVVTNVLYDFGWEYVWHCHILSHEEMDMMRPIVMKYDAVLPPAFTATANGNVVTWNDPTPVSYTTAGEPADPETYRNAANEIGFNVYRSTNGVDFTRLNAANLPANSTSFIDTSPVSGGIYKVEAFNAKGSTFSSLVNPMTVTLATTNGPTFTAPATVNLEAAISIPGTYSVAFYNGTTLLGTTSIAPYSYSWLNVMGGTYSITARVTDTLNAITTSAPLEVTVAGTLTADFTIAGSAAAADIGFCESVDLSSTSSGGTISGYSWSIGGTGSSITIPANTLVPGVYPVTLTVSNTGGETASITKNVVIVNHAPTATPGGPYSVLSDGSLTLAGSGSDTQDSCNATPLAYAWNVDNKGNYDYFTANPTISYKTLYNVLGSGVHTLAFRVTDANGGVGTATTTLTVGPPPAISITAPANGITFATGSTIAITAVAAADATTISQVEFYDGTTLLHTDTTAPYSYNFTGAAVGAHVLTAKATNSNGLPPTSIPVNVTVAAVPPTVSITAPASGATFASVATIPITATATSDRFLTIVKVEFFDGATLLNTATIAPYSYNWSGAAVGAHTLTAKVTDSIGAVATATTSLTVSPTKPAGIVRGLTTLGFDTTQAAYDAALTGETILLTGGILSGGLLADQPKNVIIRGGSNVLFTASSGMTKIGSVNIRKGKVRFDRVSQ